MGWGAILGYEQGVHDRRDRWLAVRGFYADHDDLIPAVKAIYGLPYSGGAGRGIGSHAPVCVKVTWQRDALGIGRALVLAHYETPRKEREGHLIRQVGQTSRYIKYDIHGGLIQGTDPTTGDTAEVVEGSPSAVEPSGTYILQTAYSSLSVDRNLWETEMRQGKVNKNSMNNFPGAGRWTLLYLGASVMPRQIADLIYVDHVFLYKRRGWNGDLRVQEGQWKVVGEPIVHPDPEKKEALTDADGYQLMRAVRRWFPKQKVTSTTYDYLTAAGVQLIHRTYADAGPSWRHNYQTADFSDLDNMVVW